MAIPAKFAFSESPVAMRVVLAGLWPNTCSPLRREYANFRVSSDGEVQGVGLLIASDPSSGRLIVLAPISGGPADRAGMRPGDEVHSSFDTGTEAA